MYCMTRHTFVYQSSNHRPFKNSTLEIFGDPWRLCDGHLQLMWYQDSSRCRKCWIPTWHSCKEYPFFASSAPEITAWNDERLIMSRGFPEAGTSSSAYKPPRVLQPLRFACSKQFSLLWYGCAVLRGPCHLFWPKPGQLYFASPHVVFAISFWEKMGEVPHKTIQNSLK